jgi:hypothetical protein
VQDANPTRVGSHEAIMTLRSNQRAEVVSAPRVVDGSAGDGLAGVVLDVEHGERAGRAWVEPHHGRGVGCRRARGRLPVIAMRAVFADLKTDFDFKKIVGAEEHKDVLNALLNALLDLAGGRARSRR